MIDRKALEEVAHRAIFRRGRMTPDDQEYYRMPEPGAFVGEHTGFVVIPAETLLELLGQQV